jgi:xylulokinase
MNKGKFILTIDVGTTNLKCILFGEDGNQVVKRSLSNTTRYPQPFFAEQEPHQWLNNLAVILGEMSQICPQEFRSIEAIALTGQMHGPVLLEDQKGEVAYPCIIWSDTRAAEEVEILQKEFSAEFFSQHMGNPLQQSLTLPKIFWLKRHKPEVLNRTAKVVFPKDYIGCILGGEITTDYSDASGSLFYNLYSRCWEKELWEALGLSPAMLPEVVSGDTVIGFVSEEAARIFSLPSGIPIVKGGGDLATTALATGAGQEGNVSLCIGTAGQLLFCMDRIEEEVMGKLYLFLQCLGDNYFCLGTVPAGGVSLDWFFSLFGIQDLNKLWERVEKIERISLRRAILFYPFLLGTGTPHFNYHASAGFLGLQMNHKVEDVLIAILEGITFALQDSLRKTPAIDEKVKKVILSGGLVRLPVLPQIVSNVFNRPVFLSRYLDTASVGAFFLAMRAMGRDYGDILEGGYGMACLPEDVYVQYYRRVYDLYQSFLDVILSFALQTSAYFKEET